MLVKPAIASSAATPRPRSATDIQRAVQRIENLPSLTETAARALTLANDPNTTLGDYASVIKRDGALATAILKLANSAVYRTSSPVTSLQQAVLRLGLRTCSQLITTASMRGLYRDAAPKTLERCEVLWRHGFFTACLCTQINSFLGLGFVGEEFTGGLLHDLGRTLLALVLPDDIDHIDPLDFNEGEKRPLREKELLGTDHCELGASYCQHNGLPAALVACNRLHHNPLGAILQKADNAHLVALVGMVDHIVNEVTRTHQIRTYVLASNPGYAAFQKNWGSVCNRPLAQNLPALVVKALRAARSMLKCLSIKWTMAN